MDYSQEPIITATNLSSSSPERREADAGREGDRRRRDRNKWLVSTTAMTMTKMEERGEEITQSSSSPAWASQFAACTSTTHPWQTSTAKHQREEKRSARGHGVPPRGKAFLNPSLHTHIHTRCSHSHSTCPLDLTIKTQEQIS